MEILVQRRLLPDVTVAVLRLDRTLWTTPYLDDPDPPLRPIGGQLLKVWSSPVAVVGALPTRVERVEARGASADVEQAGGVWIGVTTAENELRDPFVYLRDDGVREPVPSHHWLGLPAPLPGSSSETQAFGLAVATAIVDDLVAHPPPGALVRIVIRVFPSPYDPSNLSIHVLGRGDPQPVGQDAYFPLAWENEQRELARTDRVLGSDPVRAATAAVAATAPQDEDERTDLFDVAHEEIWSALADLIPTRGLELDRRFEIEMTGFEGP